MEDSVRSKIANCKLAMSNVVTRKDKNEIDKNVKTFNIKLSKKCTKQIQLIRKTYLIVA